MTTPLPPHRPSVTMEGSSSESTYTENRKKDFQRSRLRQFLKNAKTFLVDGFHPVFFAPVMGTAISANILYSFAFPARWLQICAYIMGTISLIIFILGCLLFILALFQRNGVWQRLHRDPKVAPFVGCMVMGYTALMMFLHSITRESWVWALWVLWWIAAALSVYSAFVTVFLSLLAKHRNQREPVDYTDISFTYLLPVVTLTVAALMGGNVAEDLPSTQAKIITAVVSFLMWSIAVFFASIITTVVYWRLFTHKLPGTAAVFTLYLPIGFLGQGAFGILVFGKNCVTLIMENHDLVLSLHYSTFIHESAEKIGDVGHFATMLAVSIMVCTTAVAMFLIAFGYFATFLAVASTLSKSRPFAKKPNLEFVRGSSSPALQYFDGLLRFNRGFWSMTFPLGTMAQANVELWRLYNGMRAFRYISAIYSVVLLCITIGCLFGVVVRGIQMLTAPSKDACKEEV